MKFIASFQPEYPKNRLKINISSYMKLIILLVIAAVTLAGCSKKADLVGTWRANLDGENTITLNADQSASATIDIKSLFGRVKGNSTGTWTLLEKNRILLEFDTRGVKTTEINKYEIKGDDLILTREDNGKSHRYTRVASEPAEKTAKPSDESDKRSPDDRIKGNVWMISASASQFFLENDRSKVTYEELITGVDGQGGYFKPMTPVAGEVYKGLVLERGKAFTVRTKDGRPFSQTPQ